MNALQRFFGRAAVATASALMVVSALAPVANANIVITEYDRDDFPKKNLMNYLLNGTVAYLKEHKDEEGIKKLKKLFGPNGSGWTELYNEALPICRSLEEKYRAAEKQDPTDEQKKKLHSYFESALKIVLDNANIEVPTSVLDSLGEESRQLIFATADQSAKPITPIAAVPTHP